MALLFNEGLQCKKRLISLVRHITSSTTRSRQSQYDYDLLVIGGGSGGLACSKEAAILGKKVAVLDYVAPSPQGSSWGLGGTCVNVGCIPKKLMHQASLLRSAVEDSVSYGWNNTSSSELTHSWETLVSNVKNHILSLNWGHRVQLKEKRVDYYNCHGSFVDDHTLQATDKDGKIRYLTGENIVLAVGGRPFYPSQVKGAREYGISSDDLFSLKKPPGKTLVIGGSYVALECAGFLNGLGYPTSVMIRSAPLKSFDQDLAKLVVDDMEGKGVEIIRGFSPLAVDESYSESQRKLKVTYGNGQVSDEITVDTVLFATGRKAVTTDLKLDTIGIQLDDSTGRVKVNEADVTSIAHIFAIGDVAWGRPELTPVAIMAGKLLARRLFTKTKQVMNYNMVPTTVFTPLEYGAVGLSEQQAITTYGEDNVEVYHSFYKPLEFYLPSRDAKHCYIKAICLTENKGDKQKVIGLHLTGPNAGEIIQGFSVALKYGVSIEDIQSTVGIHPTSAEEIVKLHITKKSGIDPTVTAC